jgi:hypothetical protein
MSKQHETNAWWEKRILPFAICVCYRRIYGPEIWHCGLYQKLYQRLGLYRPIKTPPYIYFKPNFADFLKIGSLCKNDHITWNVHGFQICSLYMKHFSRRWTFSEVQGANYLYL